MTCPIEGVVAARGGLQRYTGHLPNPFPIAPPIEPMLAKLAEELPTGGAFLYER